MPDSRGNGRKERASGKGHGAADSDKAPVRLPADVHRLMAKVRRPYIMNLDTYTGQRDYDNEK